jgi:HD superfamily phosphohydrolase
MYWQVYLHKTVLSAEKMLVKIIQRVRDIYKIDDAALKTNSPIDYFIQTSVTVMDNYSLDQFCQMDDDDVMFAIKRWSRHPDKVLSILCNGILNRKLLKCTLQSSPVSTEIIHEICADTSRRLNISAEEASYLVFTGEAVNTTYRMGDERINILFKDGSVRDISKVDNPLIHQALSTPVKKFYICQLKL